MFSFPEPDLILEAGGDGPARQVQRANRAGQDTINDRNAVERDTVAQIQKRLGMLKTGLQQRLLGADGGLTDFRRFNLQSLLSETDRLIAQATIDLADIANRSYKRAADTGESHATDPLRAMQLHVDKALPGLDSTLVTSAFDNTTDLLTMPMQQFATDVKVAARRVTLAGDNRQDEINRLRDKIGGAGFDSAAYKAERIIRTEVGRVFSQATYDRMTALTKDFPFLRKGWRASKDNRTRKGHLEAAEKYARGQGIPMADRFKLNVYDERGGSKGKPAKSAALIGVASLRFPLDPETTPAGRVAAGATIMCRCNSFVDINLADYAQFTKAKVQMALGKVKPPASAPAPVPEPVVTKAPKAKPQKPVVKQPNVKVPTAADVMPSKAPLEPSGPTGPKVSAAVQVDAGYDRVVEALAKIDSVHGDGNLPQIPGGIVRSKKAKRSSTLAYYAHDRAGNAIGLGFKKSILKTAPNMTVFHEMGHFLDHKGLGIGPSFATASMALATTEQRSAFGALMKNIEDSTSMQTLKTWRKAAISTDPWLNGGNGVVPLGVQRPYLDYLLQTNEAFARSYAQYITVVSGDKAALKELRNMQGIGTTGPVERSRPFSKAQVTHAQKPEPGTWGYPLQWSDEDFAPIRSAFDTLFEAMGWRKR